MKKKILLLLIIAIAIYAVIFLFPDKKPENKTTEKTRISAGTTAERIDYFALHGWEVEEISEKEIIIPAEFSGAYEEYAVIQDKQGLPLREYAGKNARLFTYSVRNYSPENQKMNAELIVCNDIIVASLVYSEDTKTRLAVS